MGYDLHITHADDWTQSRVHPISETDWLAVVASDPELEMSTTDFYERKVGGTIERIYDTYWTVPNGERTAVFWLADGRITVKYRDRIALKKIVKIARKLGARLLGDDGEEYT